MDIPTWIMTTVTPLGALVGVIVLIGWAIIKGALMPEKTYQLFMDARDREVAALTKALEISQAQVTALTETAETTNALLTSLHLQVEDSQEA